MKEFEIVTQYLAVYVIGALIAGAAAFGVVHGTMTPIEAVLWIIVFGLLMAVVGLWAILPITQKED